MPGRNDVAKLLDEAIDNDANHGAGDWAMMDVVGRFMAASVKKTTTTISGDNGSQAVSGHTGIVASSRILFIFDAVKDEYSWGEAQQEYGRTQLVPGASNALTLSNVGKAPSGDDPGRVGSLHNGTYDVYYV